MLLQVGPNNDFLLRDVVRTCKFLRLYRSGAFCLWKRHSWKLLSKEVCFLVRKRSCRIQRARPFSIERHQDLHKRKVLYWRIGYIQLLDLFKPWKLLFLPLFLTRWLERCEPSQFRLHSEQVLCPAGAGDADHSFIFLISCSHTLLRNRM